MPDNISKLFLSMFFVLAVIGFGSCGTGESVPSEAKCDLTSQTNAQRVSTREDYYPEVFLSDFSRDYGKPEFSRELSEDYYDTARKVSRSVFEIEFKKGSSSCSQEAFGHNGTGWLIAPKYVVTAAHNITKGFISCLHTFDGKTIKAEKTVYYDLDEDLGTDLAVLELKEEIDAIPMKIADRGPGRNEVLMAIGHDAEKSRGLGAWTVTAGPALKLESGYEGIYVSRGKRNIMLKGRILHALPTGRGMSGGPIFNRKGEVVSIVSGGVTVVDVKHRFGVDVFPKPAAEKLRLWLYGFDQRETTHVSYGPNPSELRELYKKEEIPGLEEPVNAGEYRDDNNWERTDHQLGNYYSPFPVDQFEHMNEVYKEARKGAVTIEFSADNEKFGGSGFIYDDSTVITAGHVVAAAKEKDLEVSIRTIDDKRYAGRIVKIQNEPGTCDIAIITTDLRGDNGIESAAKKLEIGDSSSLKCGDPLVQIGSGHLYNNAGLLQGVGAVYQRTRGYISEFSSPSMSGGMSGGPIVNEKGEVIALSSSVQGPSFVPGSVTKWEEPGPLFIHTRLPVVDSPRNISDGPNSETMKRFIENRSFYCP